MKLPQLANQNHARRAARLAVACGVIALFAATPQLVRADAPMPAQADAQSAAAAAGSYAPAAPERDSALVNIDLQPGKAHARSSDAVRDAEIRDLGARVGWGITQPTHPAPPSAAY